MALSNGSALCYLVYICITIVPEKTETSNNKAGRHPAPTPNLSSSLAALRWKASKA